MRSKQWLVGELKRGGDPVLVRHRLHGARKTDPKHEWLAIVTHHLASVQGNGLPEADYNVSLQNLDLSIITALERGRGDQVVLVETCHGKRHYYAYVGGFDAVGRRVQRLIEEYPTESFSYRTALDPDRRFVNEYIALLS